MIKNKPQNEKKNKKIIRKHIMKIGKKFPNIAEIWEMKPKTEGRK